MTKFELKLGKITPQHFNDLSKINKKIKKISPKTLMKNNTLKKEDLVSTSTKVMKDKINSKYYKNKASYSATFYDKKGKLLKNTNIKFKLSS